MRTKHIFLLLSMLLLSTCWAEPADKIWQAVKNIDWYNLKSLPIQDGGRIKPLDTFARSTLLRLSGKSTLRSETGKMTAIQWLTQLLFDGESSKDYPVFLVENPRVLDAMGLTYKKPRDRYSYNTLRPGLWKLGRLAMEAQTAADDKRSRVQKQMIQLYHNLIEYDELLNAFSFLQTTGHANMHPSNVLTIFPPKNSKMQHWNSPWSVSKIAAMRENEHKKNLESLIGARKAYRKGDWKSANEKLALLRKQLTEAAQKRGEYRKISLEIVYNESDLFFRSLLLYLLGLILCAFSWMGWGAKKFYIVSMSLLALGYLAHTAGMVMRVAISGRPPVSTLYETIVFVAWMGMSIGFALEWIFRERVKTISLASCSLLAVILLFVAGKYTSEGDSMGVMQAVLDSNFWLATHVTTITIGYSACLVAGAVGHVFVLMYLFAPGLAEKWKKDVYRMMYGSVAFALIFAFLGTILGGLWADQSWGRFWGWDPKENGALLIVLWNALLLHARMAGYIKEWGMALGVIFGNIIVATAWWGVNLLNVGLHSYGFSSGLALNLAVFAVVEMLFIFIGTALAIRYRKPPKIGTG